MPLPLSRKKESIARLIAVLTLVLMSIAAVMLVQDLLLATMIAFVIHYLLSPFANFLERAGMARKLAISLIFCLSVLFLVIFLYFLFPLIMAQFASLQTELPRYISGVTAISQKIEIEINAFLSGYYTIDISHTFSRLMNSFSQTSVNQLPSFISSCISLMILSPVLAFFMLLDGKQTMNRLLAIVPNNFFETSLNLLHQINLQIGGLLRARLIEGVIVGVLVFIGLIAIDFPYPIFLALFAALTNLIPYIGPILGSFPAIIISIVNDGSGVNMLIIITIYLFAQLIDNFFIVPMIVAKIVNLHAVIVIVVAIAGAQIGGIVGMIVSIPVASILKLTAITLYDHFTATP